MMGAKISLRNTSEGHSGLDLSGNNVDERMAIAERAQAVLKQLASLIGFRKQVLDIFARGWEIVRDRGKTARKSEELGVC